MNSDDSYSKQGSYPPLIDEAELSPLTGKLFLKGVQTGFETHDQQFIKGNLGKLHALLKNYFFKIIQLILHAKPAPTINFFFKFY